MTEILAGIGLTFIITQSSLFKWLRKWKLFSCTMCFGFWAGCLTSFPLLLHGEYLQVLNNALAVSLLSYVLYLLVKPLIDKYD